MTLSINNRYYSAWRLTVILPLH